MGKVYCVCRHDHRVIERCSSKRIEDRQNGSSLLFYSLGQVLVRSGNFGCRNIAGNNGDRSSLADLDRAELCMSNATSLTNGVIGAYSSFLEAVWLGMVGSFYDGVVVEFWAVLVRSWIFLRYDAHDFLSTA